jgi:hypothetical protein
VDEEVCSSEPRGDVRDAAGQVHRHLQLARKLLER